MTETIDLDLVNQIMAYIPQWTWPLVKDALIEKIVDSMPWEVLQKLTGDPDNFDRAEEILHDHYVMPDSGFELLLDSIQILGLEYVVAVLDAMELDKFKEPTDTTPCSINTD